MHVPTHTHTLKHLYTSAGCVKGKCQSTLSAQCYFFLWEDPYINKQ